MPPSEATSQYDAFGIAVHDEVPDVPEELPDDELPVDEVPVDEVPDVPDEVLDDELPDVPDEVPDDEVPDDEV